MTDEISAENFNASDVNAEIEAQIKDCENARQALLLAARRADANIEDINALLASIDIKEADLRAKLI